ncbi:hypothetical protein [Mesorhizobium marinum]|uniref:hypothetical protein n=1 Tax=Mesorhizobium marinum TaxID=3228790 RepID=UPI0034657B22
MAAAMNPAAPHYLPVFVTAPGDSDVFLNGAAIFLVVMVIGLGSVYFRLHALPERLAHKNTNKVQFEIVAVLALLGLFTHNNLFWISALILALVPVPDFHGPLATMADSLAKMAGYPKGARDETWPTDASEPTAAALHAGDEASPPSILAKDRTPADG